MKALFLLGRMIVGGFFLYNGINHFKQTEALAQYAKYKGVPNPETAVLAAGALIAAGGTSMILGLKPRLGALAVIAFLGTVSPAIHDFWNEQEAQNKQNQMIHFSKNMALLGAALALAGIEEWPLSLAE